MSKCVYKLLTHLMNNTHYHYSITAGLIVHSAILMIMSVSTIVTTAIFYIY